MIRDAKQEDADILTQISFHSKGYWNYPKGYFDIWAKELTISPDYILNNDVFVFENSHSIIGYYSIVRLQGDMEISGVKIQKGVWLEHMFIEPSFIKKGIGTKMFGHLRIYCRTKGVQELGILADPNSKGFYEKMGCQYVQEYPSTIKNRTTPYLVLKI